MNESFDTWQAHAASLPDAILSVLAAPNAGMPESTKDPVEQIRAAIRFGALTRALTETLKSFSEPTDRLLKDLIPVGSKIKVDEYSVNHHATAGKVDAELWKLAVETDEKVGRIEAAWEAACAERNKERAAYAEVGTSLRWTMPK